MAVPESSAGSVVAAPRPILAPNAIRIRSVSWLLLPVLLAAYWWGTSLSDSVIFRILLARASYGIPVLLIVVASIMASSRSHTIERRFWALVAVANASLFLCEVLLAWWLVAWDPNGPPRVSWPFQAMHLVAAAAFIGALISMTRLPLSTLAARIRYGIEIAVVAGTLYAAALIFYARPAMEPAGGTIPEILAGAAYPVASALLLGGAVMNFLGLKAYKWRSWERLVIVALGVYVVGVALWPMWFVSAGAGSRNEARNILDLVQLSGHYVLLMAAVYRLTEGDEWFVRPLPPLTLTSRRWLAAITPLHALAGIAVVAVAAVSSAAEPMWLAVYAGIGGLLLVLPLARGSLLALEHSTLFHRSITDPLTGLYNHRFFHDRLDEECDAASSASQELSVIVVDIDDFETINLAHGRIAGDRLLASLASSIRSVVGPQTIVARIGGDELGLIMPNAGMPDAALVCQRVLDHVNIDPGTEFGRVTASAGIACFPEHADTSKDLFRLADCALAWAKERGKGRAVLYEPGRVPDLSPRERIEQMERSSRLASVRALAAAVDTRDPATRNHSQSVAQLATSLAAAVGLSEDHVHAISMAALMHDVGKIGIPDSILRTTSPLTAEERRRVQEHSVLGQRILVATEFNEILPWVRAHHERWDGAGYPDRLAGEEIPLEARILAICDAYDAMTSDRPYRPAMGKAAALQEIDLNIGTQFDPQLADTFIRMVCEHDAVASLP